MPELDSAELLEALIESVADGLYLVDPEGRIEFVNRAAVQILGYDDEGELLGRPSHATIHSRRPDGSPFPEAECPLLLPRTTGESVRVVEDWFVRRDGSMVPVSYSSAPFARPGGRAAVVVFRDTTALRRAVLAGEVEASRRRLVEAADAERRRLGRDLHDGAQQRLVNVVIALQLLGGELRAASGDDGSGNTADLAARAAGLADQAERALEEARGAIEDLRELAAGLHPSVLTNRGLRAAVVARTASVPVPVTIDVLEERLPASIEAAAYFVVAEAITNVVKHAGATEATVHAQREGDELRVTVEDDGIGGATTGAGAGSGLRGLTDRVQALGGTLAVGDRAGGGTALTATLPLA